MDIGQRKKIRLYRFVMNASENSKKSLQVLNVHSVVGLSLSIKSKCNTLISFAGPQTVGADLHRSDFSPRARARY